MSHAEGYAKIKLASSFLSGSFETASKDHHASFSSYPFFSNESGTTCPKLGHFGTTTTLLVA